jgi:hypothetical protein
MSIVIQLCTVTKTVVRTVAAAKRQASFELKAARNADVVMVQTNISTLTLPGYPCIVPDVLFLRCWSKLI